MCQNNIWISWSLVEEGRTRSKSSKINLNFSILNIIVVDNIPALKETNLYKNVRNSETWAASIS